MRLHAADDDDAVRLPTRTYRGIRAFPSFVVPTTMVSMVDLTGTPIVFSVNAVAGKNFASWPSAVAPPWLPMAGKDERLPAELLNLINGLFDDGRDVRQYRGCPPVIATDHSRLDRRGYFFLRRILWR